MIFPRFHRYSKSGNYIILKEFGELLKQHPRTEERLLFPMLDDILNSEELDSVFQANLSTDYSYCLFVLPDKSQ